MRTHIHTEISESPLDILKASAFVEDPTHGAICTFTGIVRNHHEGKAVTGITYDIHKVLAEKTMTQICEEASARWAGTRYYVTHYAGQLSVGGVSVVIAVSSAHRAESFDACRYVIEEMKTRAPVWKQEHYTTGNSAWLPGHSLRQETSTKSSCCGACGGGGHDD